MKAKDCPNFCNFHCSYDCPNIQCDVFEERFNVPCEDLGYERIKCSECNFQDKYCTCSDCYFENSEHCNKCYPV